MAQKPHDMIRPLTGLRAIAALWVVLVHVELAHPTNSPYWADLLLGSFGTLPVVFFFALSGFILTVVYSGRIKGSRFCRQGISDYAWARFARIIPLYLVSLMPALLILFVRMNFQNTAKFLDQVGIGSKFLEMQGSLLDYLLRINIPAWTLAAELVFYALFPYFLRKIINLPTPTVWRWVGGSLAVYLGVQAGLTAYFYSNSTWFGSFAHGVSHFSPPVFVPVFFVGMLLGLIYVRGLIPDWVQRRTGLIYLGLGITILGSAMLREPLLPVSLVSAFITPLFCLAILAGSVKGNRTNKVLSSPIFQSLGTASYAIYITHWPVRDMVQPFFTDLGLQNFPRIVGWLTIATAILVGYSAHLWVEKPLHRKITEWQKRKALAREMLADVSED